MEITHNWSIEFLWACSFHSKTWRYWQTALLIREKYRHKNTTILKRIQINLDVWSVIIDLPFIFVIFLLTCTPHSVSRSPCPHRSNTDVLNRWGDDWGDMPTRKNSYLLHFPKDSRGSRVPSRTKPDCWDPADWIGPESRRPVSCPGATAELPDYSWIGSGPDWGLKQEKHVSNIFSIGFLIENTEFRKNLELIQYWMEFDCTIWLRSISLFLWNSQTN